MLSAAKMNLLSDQIRSIIESFAAAVNMQHRNATILLCRHAPAIQACACLIASGEGHMLNRSPAAAATAFLLQQPPSYSNKGQLNRCMDLRVSGRLTFPRSIAGTSICDAPQIGW